MDLGMPELIFIFFLALLIFGPAKLPKLGREVGRALGEFKRASNEFKNQLEEEVRRLEVMEEEKKAAPPPEPPTGTIASGTMAHDGPLEHPTQAPPAEPIQFSALSHQAAWEEKVPPDRGAGGASAGEVAATRGERGPESFEFQVSSFEKSQQEPDNKQAGGARKPAEERRG